MYPLINRDNSCCFSGYRPEKLPWGSDEGDPRCSELKERIFDSAKRIHLTGIRHFICGMARGSDTFFCEAVLALREEYPAITIEAAIPCVEQPAGWRADDRARYFRLVGQCDHVTYVSRDYSRSCMHRRNRYMVDSASVLLAVFDGKRGGTNHTFNYAVRRGLEIVELQP